MRWLPSPRRHAGCSRGAAASRRLHRPCAACAACPTLGRPHAARRWARATRCSRCWATAPTLRWCWRWTTRPGSGCALASAVHRWPLEQRSARACPFAASVGLRALLLLAEQSHAPSPAAVQPASYAAAHTLSAVLDSISTHRCLAAAPHPIHPHPPGGTQARGGRAAEPRPLQARAARDLHPAPPAPPQPHRHPGRLCQAVSHGPGAWPLVAAAAAAAGPAWCVQEKGTAGASIIARPAWSVLRLPRSHAPAPAPAAPRAAPPQQCRLIGGRLVNMSVDVYIAMELADGGDLFHLRGQMSGAPRTPRGVCWCAGLQRPACGLAWGGALHRGARRQRSPPDSSTLPGCAPAGPRAQARRCGR